MVEIYGPLVGSWCRVANVPADRIPDVAQNVFLTAFRGVTRFDPAQPAASFRGWLWTITRTRIIDEFRRIGREPQAEGGSAALEVLHTFEDRLPAEDPTDADQLSAALHRALELVRGRVEPETWDMFWRSAVLGQRFDVVAESCGVSPAAVRQAKSRVLRRLRQQLGDVR